MSTKPNTSVTWEYGVTTIPERLNTTLPSSIHSLQRAGFARPRLFIDGVDIPDRWRKFNLPITSRWPKVGAMQNWILSLSELYYRNPVADLYAIFQDDILCVGNLRRYIERFVYPADGYLNLYTCDDNQRAAVLNTLNTSSNSIRIGIGWFKASLLGKGALGLVFNADCVRRILSTDYIPKKVLDPKRGNKNIDGAVIHIMRNNGFTEWCHSPTLIQHTGSISTINNKPGQFSSLFQGEEYDIMSMLKS